MASSDSAPRAKGAGFLFLVGFALVALGVGFAFAPQYSWQVEKIARQAAAFGVQNGTLVVGGLFFFGLAIVARAAGAPAPVHDTRSETETLQAELQLVNEQLSTKLAQLRTALMQVHESVGAVATQQQAQLQAQGEKSPANDHSQDAVFRLAASLDKLHAHLDERVHAVDLQLRSGFEALLNASQEVRRVLSSVPAPQAGVGAHPAQAPASHGGGIDFYETMQKLDAIAGDGHHGAGRGGHPQAPFPSQGQSLDTLLPEEYRDRY
jgi:hypothetical protein